MRRIGFVVQGKPVGVNAAYKVVQVPTRRGMRSRLAKTVRASTYARDIAVQGQQAMRRAGLATFARRVSVELIVYYEDRRPDIDGPLKQLLDALQVTKRGRLGAGIYRNDSQVDELHVYRRIDPVTPRVEVCVSELSEGRPGDPRSQPPR